MKRFINLWPRRQLKILIYSVIAFFCDCRATNKLFHLVYLGRFPKVRTGRPDHGWPNHFDKARSFFQEFLLQNHLLRAYYFGFDISGWIVLIRSEIAITTGMVRQVSSDKWKAPLDSNFWKWHQPKSSSPAGLSLCELRPLFLFYIIILFETLNQHIASPGFKGRLDFRLQNIAIT